MLQIPLSTIPNQSFTVDLDEKRCSIDLITRNGSLYVNKFYIEDELRASGIICLNKNNILSLFNSGLNGSLYFKDLQGDEEPKYTGFNERWILVYEGK